MNLFFPDSFLYLVEVVSAHHGVLHAIIQNNILVNQFIPAIGQIFMSSNFFSYIDVLVQKVLLLVIESFQVLSLVIPLSHLFLHFYQGHLRDEFGFCLRLLLALASFHMPCIGLLKFEVPLLHHKLAAFSNLFNWCLRINIPVGLSPCFRAFTCLLRRHIH